VDRRYSRGRRQAGAGTLVQYGTQQSGCNDVALQFDAGRGTTQRLSQAGVPVGKLSAMKACWI